MAATPDGSVPFNFVPETLADANQVNANFAAVLGAIPVLNVATFGAKGDGVTDDTAAIQNALNTAVTIAAAAGSASGNAIVYFPAGTYHVTSQPTNTDAACLQISNAAGIVLAGCGTSSTIACMTDNDVIIVTGGGPTFIIRDLLITAQSTGQFINQFGAAVHITSAFLSGGLYFDNLRTSGVGYGLKLDKSGGGDTSIFRCVIKANYVAVYSAHSLHFLHSDIVGGTYGVFMDNPQLGLKVTNCRFFGAASLVLTNTQNLPQNGISTYLYNLECNYSTPPDVNGGTLVQATDSATLAGTPTTGQSCTFTINGFPTTVAQTTGQSLAQYNNAVVLAINNDLDLFGLVTANGPANVLLLTAQEDGVGGNNITFAFSTTGGVTASGYTPNFEGGSGQAIWPGIAPGGGLPGDIYASMTGGNLLGVGDYLLFAATAELHLVNCWGSTIVIGSSLFGGPVNANIIGGLQAATAKGLNRVSMYAIDVMQLDPLSRGDLCITGVSARCPSGVPGGIIHLAQNAYNVVVTGSKLYNNQGTHPVLVVDDATQQNQLLFADNMTQGTDGNIYPVSLYEAIGVANMPNTSIRNNQGVNPTGISVAINTSGWTNTQVIINTTGFDSSLYITGGTTVTYEVYNPVTQAYSAGIPATAGVPIPWLAGQQLQILSIGIPSSALQILY